MKNTKKKSRVIVGVAAFLTGVIFSFCFNDILGGISFVFAFIGGIIFVYLNPELMRGE